MLLATSKYQAYGNDFLVLREADVPPDKRERWTVLLCRRNEGVGADGCVFVAPRVEGGWAFHVFNQDGGEAEMSGNGLRCAGAFLLHRGLAVANVLEFETRAGRRSLELLDQQYPEWVFRGEMGRPSFEPSALPFLGPCRTREGRPTEAEMEIDGERLQVLLLSMGNPQAVVILDHLPEDAEFQRWGRALATHPSFPRQTNVSFVEVDDVHSVRARIWERGVGPTWSSGTGCCGAAVAAVAWGLVQSPVTVRTDGGAQTVEWSPGGCVFLTGSVRFVADVFWESGEIGEIK